MCKVELGIDTFSCYYTLTPKQKSKILKHLREIDGFHTRISNYFENTYAYSSDCFQNDGIRLWIQRKCGKPWGLLVVVHPALVLGSSERSALYQPQWKSEYQEIVKAVDKILKPVGVPCSVDKMKLYRIDVTANLIFEDSSIVDEYIRLLRKSCLLPHYALDLFRKKEHKAKNCNLVNRHSHKQYCQSAAFFSYDKTAQLEMIDAFPDALIGKRILRLEAQLRRQAMKKWVGKNGLEENNWNILKKLGKNSEKIIQWYIKRLQPEGKYIRYKDAVELVKTAKLKEKTRARMLYLLRKTSDKESLTAALKDLKVERNLTGSQCRTVLKMFQKLGINPITLTNSSELDELPPVVF